MVNPRPVDASPGPAASGNGRPERIDPLKTCRTRRPSSYGTHDLPATGSCAPLRAKRLRHDRFERFHRRLTAMGFDSYQDFLRSPLWRTTRARFLRQHPECFVCGTREGVQPHHRTYKRIGREQTGDYYRSDLVTLCGPCHGRTHRLARFRLTQNGADKERLYGAHTDVRLHWPHRSEPCGSVLCKVLWT